MTINIKNYVIQELEAYPRILRQISVLRYEMEHPAHVSAQEMLDAMAYACGDRTGSSPGHVSDKTFYIAMNYRQKAAAANSEISEEISAKLLELERKKGRIEYYVGMLDSRKANVIRLCFFEGRTIEDAAEELNISAKTAQIAKKKAIEELTDLFALTSNINYCDRQELLRVSILQQFLRRYIIQSKLHLQKVGHRQSFVGCLCPTFLLI